MRKDVIALVVVGMVLVSFASAAIVPYLSNVVTGMITVDSPLKLEIAEPEGNQGWHSGSDPFYIGEFNAGEEITFKLRVTNEIDSVVDSLLLVHMMGEEEENIYCDDFVNMKVEGVRHLDGVDDYNLYYDGPIFNCTEILGGDIIFTVEGNYLPEEVEDYYVYLKTALDFTPSSYLAQFVEADSEFEFGPGGFLP